MFSRIQFLAPLALALCLSGEVFAKTAYIGIAGAGGGQGMMGHVFLAFTELPGVLLDGKFFQYAVRLPKDFQFDATKILALGTFPFVVDTGEAWHFVKAYNKEDRVVVLYQLKLSNEQVDKLVENVEADRIARENTPHLDYSVDNNNCATKVFDMVNSVLPAESKFKYTSPRIAAATFDVLHTDQVSMAIPIGAAPQLERSPLVATKIVFRQKSLVDLSVAVTAFGNLAPLFAACKISEQAQAILSEMYASEPLRHSTAYLKLFDSVAGNCARENSTVSAIYNGHIDFLRFDTDETKFLDLSKQYYIGDR